MHIKLLYRKVLYVFLSVMIVFANTQTAYAASSWNVTSVASAGSRVIVSASKAGYKSAINIAPTADRLGIKLVKGANWAALLYAALQLAPDLADIKSFQPDYANNNVKYKVTTPRFVANLVSGSSSYYPSLSAAANASKAASDVDSPGYITSIVYAGNVAYGCYKYGSESYCNMTLATKASGDAVVEGNIGIDKISSKMIANAKAGHADSQKALQDTAIEMVATGDFDADFLSGAVPTSDTKPLIPAVPGTQNGNQGYGGVSDAGDGSDGGMNGATPGEQADAAKAAAEAAQKAAAAAKDAAKAASEQAARDAAAAQDLINSANDQAAIAAAEAKAAAATKAAADAKAVADAAIGAANDRAAAAERAAEAATKSAADAATKAASDLAAAKAAGDAAAIAAAEAASAAAAKELASAKEKQAAAEKAAEKAKAEAAKPFELPAFCSWASVVCEYTVWVKEEYGSMSRWLKEEPTSSPAELMPIDDDPSGLGDVFKDKAEAGYVSFESACPADVLIPIDLMGASQVLNISYAPFCHFASLIRYAVILGAWISGLLIVTGGRSRE